MAEPNAKLWVGNLSQKVSKEDLEKLFDTHGTIQEVKLLDKGPYVYAFIEFADIKNAEEAFKALQGSELKGQNLKIEYANGRKRQQKYTIQQSRFKTIQ